MKERIYRITRRRGRRRNSRSGRKKHCMKNLCDKQQIKSGEDSANMISCALYVDESHFYINLEAITAFDLSSSLLTAI